MCAPLETKGLYTRRKGGAFSLGILFPAPLLSLSFPPPLCSNSEIWILDFPKPKDTLLFFREEAGGKMQVALTRVGQRFQFEDCSMALPNHPQGVYIAPLLSCSLSLFFLLGRFVPTREG
jgi:hypothetical protein